jgi:hypothetical protein
MEYAFRELINTEQSDMCHLCHACVSSDVTTARGPRLAAHNHVV